MSRAWSLTSNIHIEEGSYWADVPELPGCFASGDTLDELFESLREVLPSTSPTAQVQGRSSQGADSLRPTALS